MLSEEEAREAWPGEDIQQFWDPIHGGYVAGLYGRSDLSPGCLFHSLANSPFFLAEKFSTLSIV